MLNKERFIEILQRGTLGAHSLVEKVDELGEEGLWTEKRYDGVFLIVGGQEFQVLLMEYGRKGLPRSSRDRRPSWRRPPGSRYGART